MQPLFLFTNSDAAYTVTAIAITAVIIAVIAVMIVKAGKLFKKKNWAYYLYLFAMFMVAYFFVALLIDRHELRYSIISGLVNGVVFTALWWIIDKAMNKM